MDYLLRMRSSSRNFATSVTVDCRACWRISNAELSEQSTLRAVLGLPILPTYVRSSADLSKTVTLNSTPESAVLEFKSELPGGWKAPQSDAKRKAQKELCRDIAQFANTYGGCLLYGVEERESGGSVVASALKPITDFDDRREWLQQAVRNFLVPATLTVQIERIDVADGCVMASTSRRACTLSASGISSLERWNASTGLTTARLT